MVRCVWYRQQITFVHTDGGHPTWAQTLMRLYWWTGAGTRAHLTHTQCTAAVDQPGNVYISCVCHFATETSTRIVEYGTNKSWKICFNNFIYSMQQTEMRWVEVKCEMAQSNKQQKWYEMEHRQCRRRHRRRRRIREIPRKNKIARNEKKKRAWKVNHYETLLLSGFLEFLLHSTPLYSLQFFTSFVWNATHFVLFVSDPSHIVCMLIVFAGLRIRHTHTAYLVVLCDFQRGDHFTKRSSRLCLAHRRTRTECNFHLINIDWANNKSKLFTRIIQFHWERKKKKGRDMR